MGIVFDLDLTIIDSSIAEQFRKRREWSEVYKLIPQFNVYDGMMEVMEALRHSGIKICIVTSSPENYCRKVLNYWKIPFDFIVCYHDTINRKPHPEPINKAISYLNIAPSNILSLGDSDIDIIASNRAHVHSVACLWGSKDINSLVKSRPVYTIETPNELIELASKFFSLSSIL